MEPGRLPGRTSGSRRPGALGQGPPPRTCLRPVTPAPLPPGPAARLIPLEPSGPLSASPRPRDAVRVPGPSGRGCVSAPAPLPFRKKSLRNCHRGARAQGSHPHAQSHLPGPKGSACARTAGGCSSCSRQILGAGAERTLAPGRACQASVPAVCDPPTPQDAAATPERHPRGPLAETGQARRRWLAQQRPLGLTGYEYSSSQL